MGCRNRTEACRSIGEVERKSQKAEVGSRGGENILKQDFGQPNEDRLYGKLAPIEAAL
jgi:hypothetical protein